MVCERQTCRPLDWTPGLPSKDTKSLHVTICSKSGPSITIISVVLILACFVSDWAVAAKWETREQETYLCQWQDRGSGVVSMCVLLSSLYLHCWKEISADHTYLHCICLWSHLDRFIAVQRADAKWNNMPPHNFPHTIFFTNILLLTTRSLKSSSVIIFGMNICSILTHSCM